MSRKQAPTAAPAAAGVVRLRSANAFDETLARLKALPGAGKIQVFWFEADPRHLYVTYTGQLTTDLPMRRLHQIHRMDLSGQEVAGFDLHRELAAKERNYGAKGFGGASVVDAQGTMLVGTTRNKVREVWRRDADGTWVFVNQFEGTARIAGDDLVYRLGVYLLARNWRSGDVRKLIYFNPATLRSEVLAQGDPALTNPGYEPTMRALVSGNRREIRIVRDNDLIASILPEGETLDRR